MTATDQSPAPCPGVPRQHVAAGNRPLARAGQAPASVAPAPTPVGPAPPAPAPPAPAPLARAGQAPASAAPAPPARAGQAPAPGGTAPGGTAPPARPGQAPASAAPAPAPGGTAPAAPLRLPAPRAPRLRRSDVVSVAGVVAAVTLGLWIAHGGVGHLFGGGTPAVRALAQLTGLAAALAALGGVVLAARPAALERALGLDTMLAWHRWTGIVAVLGVLVHLVLALAAWGAMEGRGLPAELLALAGDEPWMLAAVAAAVLFGIIGLTSWRRLRRAMAYETWYFLHLLAYLAVLLGFAHQVTVGADLAAQTGSRLWWTGLFAATWATVAWARVGGLVRAARRGPLAVATTTRETPDTVALTVAGPGLRGMRVAAGQFFVLRLLTRDGWWAPHPLSLSSAPTAAGLRFTVKVVGGGTAALAAARPGTRVLLEGPYGRSTAAAADGRPVLLVGGGVGVAPLLSVLADCTPAQAPVVVVRVRRPEDVPHRAELTRLVAGRGGRLHVLAGPRRWFAGGDPFSAAALRAAVPDVADRHAFVCGPASLESAVASGLRAAGLPSDRVSIERFDW